MQMPQLAAMAGNPTAARGLLATLQSAVDRRKARSLRRTGHRGLYNQFNNQLDARTGTLRKSNTC